MGIKFTVHTSGFDAVQETLAAACTRAEHDLAEHVEKDTQTFVPMLTGSLTQRTRVVGNAVIYPAPYARFLYYGKVMVDPNTRSTYAPKGGTKALTNRNLVFTKASHPQAQAHWFEAAKAQDLSKWINVAAKAVEKFGTG